MAQTYVVHGEVVLPKGEVQAPSGDVIVQVEDVSRADAASIVVGEKRQKHVSLDDGVVIPFTIEIPAPLIDERHSYSVRVHIDMSGSGQVRVGDMVSTQTYPVLTRGYGNQARVRVRRV